MPKYTVTIEGYTFEVELDGQRGDGPVQVWVDGAPMQVIMPELETAGQEAEYFIVDDHPYEVMIDPEMKWIRSPEGMAAMEVQDAFAPQARPPVGDGRVKAPIPGVITRVLVQPGEEVEAGQALLVLEAMKMENEIRSPRPGAVRSVHVAPGQKVGGGDLLIEVD
jgi:biotin carboxyl carrier protein